MSEPDAATSGATASTGHPGLAAAERLFAGRYRLTGRRGTGVDIALFEAADVLGDQVVAVKIVHPEICAQPGFDDRFTELIHRVAALRHPNIARIIDIGSASWNGQQVNYVVCENLTGGSMRDLRDRGRQLSPSQAVMVGLDVCRGLDVAHRAGLAHGDIRPANLVFGDDGRLRITDLGLAELVSADLWSNPASVSTDRARYASPEQATNAPVGPKSDVYSLCLCLLESVTGHLPFVGDSTVATLSNRVDRLMPVSADLGPLASVFERAGRPDPEGRSTATELGKALVLAAERLPRPQPIALLSTGVFSEAQSFKSSTDADGPDLVVTIANEIAPPPPAPQAPSPAGLPAAPQPTVAVGVTAPAESSGFVGVTPGAGPTEPGVDIPPPPQPEVPLLHSSTARRRLMKFGALVVVAAALGGALAWFLGRTTTNDVPDLVGMEQGAALNRVSEFGWNITTTEEPSDDMRAGLVLRTEPGVGVSLDDDAEFQIVVSNGAAPRTLPELTGLTLEQATAALTDLDLVVQQGDAVNDDVVPAGTVISWSVPDQAGLQAGDTVVPQTAVRLIVSLGSATRTLPELTGLTLEQATTALTELDLVVQQGDAVNDGVVPAGTVISWSVPDQAGLRAGDTVVPQTVIRVIVSLGSAPRIVPDLIGMTVPDASATLAGLSLSVVQGAVEFSDTVPVGVIVRQDPATGAELQAGSAVTVFVSGGTQFVTIPSLAGLTLEQANQALVGAGLALGQVIGDLAGVNILAQVDGVSIGAGAVFQRGTLIDLTFGQPPPTTTAPPETVPTQAPAPETTSAPA